MIKKIIPLVLLLTAVLTSVVNAGTASDSLSKFIKSRNPNLTINIVSETPFDLLKGFYIVKFKINDDPKENIAVTDGTLLIPNLLDMSDGTDPIQKYIAKNTILPIEVASDELYAGTDNTKVKIVVFSDFECPYCKKSADGMKEIINENKDKLGVYYKHMPLTIHKNAMIMAKIYEAGKKLGKNFDMYSYNAGSKDEAGIISDFEKEFSDEKSKQEFNQLVKSKDIEDKIKKHMSQAEKLGVKGTPYILINGHPISGFQPEFLKGLIKEAIEGKL